MGKLGRAVVASGYVGGAVLLLYLGIQARAVEGEFSNGRSDEWEMTVLFLASVLVGPAIGRRWALLLPLVASAMALPIALAVADGHALADLLVWLPLVAVVDAVAAGFGLGVRSLAGRLAGPSS